MTIYHILVCILCVGIFILACVLIFLKVKTLQNALAFYGISLVMCIVLLYSLFLSIEQYTRQASISNLHFIRNLNHESVVINGRVSNLTGFDIKKCFLALTIMDKVGGGEQAFRANPKDIKKGHNSVSYNVEILTNLPGNTYKDFSVQVPFPPSFTHVEFYHNLECI